MKRKISYILMAVILILQLCGCDSGNDRQGPDGEPDVSAISGLGGRDNSMDAYSSTVNVPLQVKKPAGAIEGEEARFFWALPEPFILKNISLILKE